MLQIGSYIYLAPDSIAWQYRLRGLSLTPPTSWERQFPLTTDADADIKCNNKRLE